MCATYSALVYGGRRGITQDPLHHRVCLRRHSATAPRVPTRLFFPGLSKVERPIHVKNVIREVRQSMKQRAYAEHTNIEARDGTMLAQTQARLSIQFRIKTFAALYFLAPGRLTAWRNTSGASKALPGASRAPPSPSSTTRRAPSARQGETPPSSRRGKRLRDLDVLWR